MTALSLAQAKTIVEAAMRIGAEKGLVATTVAVTDLSGAIRAMERNDAAPAFGPAIATAKARTALGFGRASIKTAAVFGDKPSVVTGLNAAVGGDFLPLGGGVLIAAEAGGKPIGAAAVAGGAPEVDHAVIAEALASAGLVCLE